MAEALEREMREETGLEVRCGELVGWAERIGADHHFVILDFEVEVTSGTLRPDSDVSEAAWVPLGEVASLSLVDGLELFLRDHGVL